MSLVLLAVMSGLVSGLAFQFDFTILPGVLFAIAIVAGSTTRFARVGPLRMLTFIGLSTLANYLAVSTTLAVENDFALADHEMIVGAAGGLVGALILGIAAAISFKLRPVWKTLAVFALVGTAAGAIFFLMPHAIVSYIIWQSAIAAVIARAWSTRRA